MSIVTLRAQADQQTAAALLRLAQALFPLPATVRALEALEQETNPLPEDPRPVAVQRRRQLRQQAHQQRARVLARERRRR